VAVLVVDKELRQIVVRERDLAIRACRRRGDERRREGERRGGHGRGQAKQAMGSHLPCRRPPAGGLECGA
jgi:hypothetical protein